MAPTRKLPKPLTLNREAALSTDLVVEMVRSAFLEEKHSSPIACVERPV